MSFYILLYYFIFIKDDYFKGIFIIYMKLDEDNYLFSYFL